MGNRAKYIVALTEEERNGLLDWVKQGERKGYKVQYGQILLALDVNSPAGRLSRTEVSEIYQVSYSTICFVARRFAKEGLIAALGWEEWVVPHVVAIAGSEVPEGKKRWSSQSIVDELVRRGVVKSISDSTIDGMLKKRNISLVRKTLVR